MNARSPKSIDRIVALTAALALIATAALAADTAAIDAKVPATLAKFYALSSNNKLLANSAAAVLVFPDVTKGGIGVGGEHGDGALQEQGKNVGYYSISGASIGATFGLAHHSEVILFNTPASRDKFLHGGDWSIGGDASVAVMEKGASTQSADKPVFVFVFGERGMMGDASLAGAKISKIAD